MVRANSVDCITIRTTKVFSGPPMEEWTYSATLLTLLILLFGADDGANRKRIWTQNAFRKRIWLQECQNLVLTTMNQKKQNKNK